MEVDAVEERSGNALAVVLDLARAAAAVALRVAEIPARAGVQSREMPSLNRGGVGSLRHAEAVEPAGVVAPSGYTWRAGRFPRP